LAQLESEGSQIELKDWSGEQTDRNLINLRVVVITFTILTDG
jgi:hypothetical protein